MCDVQYFLLVDVHSGAEKLLKVADLHIDLVEAIEDIMAEVGFISLEFSRSRVIAFVQLQEFEISLTISRVIWLRDVIIPFLSLAHH